MGINFFTENTNEVRLFLEDFGFSKLAFFQGKEYITILISNRSNSKRQWKEYNYYTFDENSKEFNEYRIFSNIYFIDKINNMFPEAINIKRKAGQPKKLDAKQRYATRLHPDIIKVIKDQPNQSAFIEHLVMQSLQNQI